MISIEECRKILGESCSSMTDEQIEDLRNNLYKLTESVIDKYLKDEFENST